MADAQGDDNDLREEVARLRAENDALRSRFRVEQPSHPQEADSPQRQLRVLLLPDPLAPTESGPGPEVVANLTRILIGQFREKDPATEWRAEHDLARIPDDAFCHHVGQLLGRGFSGTGPVPMTFRVETTETGERRIRRCLVDGDQESEQFSTAYERQLEILRDVLGEGQVAYEAGAEHHAVWTLKAADLVLARLKLALAFFQSGHDEWRDTLSEARPEYDPRYRVEADLPVGL